MSFYVNISKTKGILSIFSLFIIIIYLFTDIDFGFIDPEKLWYF